MAIKLGLQRMQAIYGKSPQLWKAIHVAGTNGKGSVCSYVSALLTNANVSHGRFTSPYIRRPEDSILINNDPIPSRLFQALYYAAGKDHAAADEPTHFERMTYAAFAAFDHFGVKYGVVETGLGGRLDSTNVLRNKAVTVITNIGLDHQEYLGDTIEQIAAEKAGIMNGAPCVIGEQTSPAVLPVLLDSARRVGSRVIQVTSDSAEAAEPESGVIQTTSDPAEVAEPGSGVNQATADSAKAAEPESRPWPQTALENARCAIKACEQLDEFQGSTLNTSDLLNMPQAHMEGRFQEVTLDGMETVRKAPIFLDGAHNREAATALGFHTRRFLRRTETGSRRPIIWVIGMSNPRENTAHEFLGALIGNHDKILFTEYSRPAGEQAEMSVDDYFLSFRPEPLPIAKLEEAAKLLGKKRNRVESRASLDEGMKAACDMARMDRRGPDGEKSRPSKRRWELPIVVTGSLYLVADVLKWIDAGKEAWKNSLTRALQEDKAKAIKSKRGKGRSRRWKPFAGKKKSEVGSIQR